MFKSVKTKIALAAELIMPYLVLVSGIPAIYYWQKTGEEWRIEYNSEAYFHASEMLELFYNMAMITGVAVIIAEIIISVVSLILMIISIVKKTKCVTKTMAVLFGCGLLSSFGTAVLMMFVLIFTYAQGI